jgi:hypothetical protein
MHELVEPFHRFNVDPLLQRVEKFGLLARSVQKSKGRRS